jgi:hypothetical protein
VTIKLGVWRIVGIVLALMIIGFFGFVYYLWAYEAYWD